MIDNGQVNNQSDIARKLGISRARVTQILNLLKLDKEKVSPATFIQDKTFSFRLSNYIRLIVGWLV